jgi:hypothetical protein
VAQLIIVPALEIGVGFLGGLLNKPAPPAPVTNNQITSSAPGAPIPFGYGFQRIPGQLIWTTGITYTTVTPSKKGGGSVIGYLYQASIAMAFCEGSAAILQVYGDSKLIYDTNPDPAQDLPSQFYPPWNSATLYNPGNLVNYGGVGWICILTNTNIIPGTNQTYWNTASGYGPWNNQTVYNPGDEATDAGQIWVCMVSNGPGTSLGVVEPYYVSDPDPSDPPPWETLRQYYGTPTFYSGAGPGTQLPDPLIQAAEGAAITPAFTALNYFTWANLPLANFGNRIPNTRALIQFPILCQC